MSSHDVDDCKEYLTPVNVNRYQNSLKLPELLMLQR
jgi:hypothetical protein